MKKGIILSMIASSLIIAGGYNQNIDESTSYNYNVETGIYIGGGYTYSMVEETGANLNEFNSNAMSLILGYNISEYLSIEGRYMTSIGDGDLSVNGGDSIDQKGDISNIGIYLKPQYTIEDFKIYALLGYGKYYVDFSEVGGYKGDESSFQYGLGVSYEITDNVSAFVDYTVLYDDKDFNTDFPDNNYKMDTVTVGLTYSF